MSQENVEIVRRYLEGVDRRDWSMLPELVDPDIEIDLSRNVFNPDVYQGYPGLKRSTSMIDDMWDEFSVSPTELIDVDGNVVAAVTLHGRNKRSGLDVTMNFFDVFTLRNRRVLRILAGYRDRSEALEAAGLSE
jgi:ketosteroid isomerase-like protein